MPSLESTIMDYKDKKGHSFDSGFYFSGEIVSPTSIYYVYNKVEQRIDENRRVISGLKTENYYDGVVLMNKKDAKGLDVAATS